VGALEPNKEANGFGIRELTGVCTGAAVPGRGGSGGLEGGDGRGGSGICDTFGDEPPIVKLG
jgi:hypothetical protein